MKKEFLKARDGYLLDVHIFEVKNANAVVQMIHGMEEHQERYEPFIKFLNQNDFTVVSSDMRGHGKSAKDLGYFKDKKGYLELIEDQKIITSFIYLHIPWELLLQESYYKKTQIITRKLFYQDIQTIKWVLILEYLYLISFDCFVGLNTNQSF